MDTKASQDGWMDGPDLAPTEDKGIRLCKMEPYSGLIALTTLPVYHEFLDFCSLGI